MKKCLFLTEIILLIVFCLHAQTPTYSEDLAPIVYQNCTKCHRAGGVAPFSLESYASAVPYASSIKYMVSNKFMPPWPPDPNYQHYVDERVLTDQEINTIIAWVDGGAPEGNPQNLPDLPNYAEPPTLGIPDLKLQIPLTQSQAGQFDEYICFALPTGLTTDRWVQKIEVVPGNPAILHHGLVYLDTTGTFQHTEPCGGVNADLMTGYVPGSGPTIFPTAGVNQNFGM